MAVPTTDALRQKATALHKAGKLAEALPLYINVVERDPHDAQAWTNLGALFRASGQHRQALRAQRRAAALGHQTPGLMNNLANILGDLGHYDEAIGIRRELLKRSPGDVSQKAMIGRALRSQGAYEQSIAYLREAVSAHPEDPELRLQLAMSLLANRDFAEGFALYDARWETGDLTPPDLPFPRWSGEDLSGKVVLVKPEQGFGDAVLFTRFLPLLKAQAAKVLYLSERPLERLFAELEGGDWVGSQLAADTRIDCYLTLMDLPKLGLGTVTDIPPPSRLYIPVDAAERAASVTAPYQDAFKVGVVWSGSTTYKGNAFRSFSHREFLPLSELPDVQLFSLYKGPLAKDLHSDGSAAFILDVGSTDQDFADCAAKMRELDLVITSDTATAHIAGSLGIPTWIVLHWDAFWFWQHEGEKTPWYPSARLFRQRTPLDWSGVFAEVRKALIQECERRT